MAASRVKKIMASNTITDARYLLTSLLVSVHEEARQTARIILTSIDGPKVVANATGGKTLITSPCPPVSLVFTVLSIFYDAPQGGCKCLHAYTATRTGCTIGREERSERGRG